ncbi:MAG: M1 family metallopeptidase [Microscillaceae bacterium]|jgi:hypothetical protein|nr:M1 family metallopeptidase [Microscillaceae bacterium]
MRYLFTLGLLVMTYWSFAQTPKQPYTSSKFEQLDLELPTPNNARMADGSAGPEYWQQRADYNIKVELNDDNQSIKGFETITYYNNSPKDLPYLWVQLDQNLFDKNADTYKTLDINPNDGNLGTYMLPIYLQRINSDAGNKILAVKDKMGNPLKYAINRTMMRIDLPAPVKAKGGMVSFSIEWTFNIVDAKADPIYTRSGYEYFDQDKNYVYEMAQWFPRMAVYNDVRGWQHKQFMGRGEFALNFGNYEVAITVPADHIVASTGELQNAAIVLKPIHLQRLEQAKTAKEPVLIVNQAEAEQAEKERATAKKTWIYKAQNVRDFAWASSRKFVWDAVQVTMENGKKAWAMSYYPKEGNPLWGKVSTKAVVQTLKTYSKHTIDYPYPVAISVHGPVGGMEYPMISFNNQGRPKPDGTWTKGVEKGTVSVIIHEVGHNFFPMIINSDERQWTWMDEGLNTFMQHITEKEWDMAMFGEDGLPPTIITYMKGDPKKLVPIMTNSEQIDLMQFGPNAYSKPAVALNILRETVMGRELFDYAFKEYARRWAFKSPEPADFFRTMEDASATDLDWFWRGWFYGTEAVDVSLESVKVLKTPTTKLSAENPFDAADFTMFGYVAMQLGEKAGQYADNYFYNLEFKNVGGLIMPVVIQANYKDGSNEIIKIPAEVWRYNPEKVNKFLVLSKEVASFVIDPNMETADIDLGNNTMPRKVVPSKFEEFKKKQAQGESE